MPGSPQNTARREWGTGTREGDSVREKVGERGRETDVTERGIQ
jgi:hypothetical protein